MIKFRLAQKTFYDPFYVDKGKNWKFNLSLETKDGVRPYYSKPNTSYDKTSLCWTIPGTDEIVSNFKVDKSGQYYRNDVARNGNKGGVPKEIIGEINKGFAFIDNDPNPSLGDYSPRSTHYLQKLSLPYDDRLVYSKDLDTDNRLTYEVFRPVKGIDKTGKEYWYCPVVLNNFIGHRYNNSSYAGGW